MIKTKINKQNNKNNLNKLGIVQNLFIYLRIADFVLGVILCIFTVGKVERRRDEMLEKIVKKYNIQTVNDGKNLRVDSTIANNPNDIEFVKSHKQEIIQYLADEFEKALAAEEEKNRKEYAHLIAKLPERKIENTPDEEKFQELISQINYNRFSGSEDDGLNTAISAGNSRIRAEAGKYCSHELKEEYEYTYTADARKKVICTITCDKCGLYIRNEASDPVLEDAVWR